LDFFKFFFSEVRPHLSSLQLQLALLKLNSWAVA